MYASCKNNVRSILLLVLLQLVFSLQFAKTSWIPNSMRHNKQLMKKRCAGIEMLREKNGIAMVFDVGRHYATQQFKPNHSKEIAIIFRRTLPLLKYHQGTVIASFCWFFMHLFNSNDKWLALKNVFQLKYALEGKAEGTHYAFSFCWKTKRSCWLYNDTLFSTLHSRVFKTQVHHFTAVNGEARKMWGYKRKKLAKSKVSWIFYCFILVAFLSY